MLGVILILIEKLQIMHYDIYIYIIGNKEKVLHFSLKIFSKSLKELLTNFLVFELNFYHTDQWSV